MFSYYNANPYKRLVNDCTVRAISVATDKTWNETYRELSDYARIEGNMLDDVMYIDRYLDMNFEKVYCKGSRRRLSVDEFVRQYTKGIYLITMRGHITCCIDGTIYDTFYPGDRLVWDVYKVKRRD